MVALLHVTSLIVPSRERRYLSADSAFIPVHSTQRDILHDGFDLASQEIYHTAVGLRNPTKVLSSKKYFFSVFCIFPNEATLIREWVAHYVRQGADHFFLIDHDSDDDTRERLREYEEAGYITYFSYHDHTNGAQVRAYNKFFPTVASASEWALLADVDEFCHSRITDRSISFTVRDVLARFFFNASFILLADLYFGNPGFIEQPKNVLCHFNQRADYDLLGLPDFVNPTLTKYFIRTSAKDGGDININNAPTASRHLSRRDGRYADKNTLGKLLIPEHDTDRVYLTEAETLSAYLIVNHYRMLSTNWYFSVRATRGNVYTGADSQLQDFEAEYGFYNPHYIKKNDTFLAAVTPYCPQSSNAT